MLRGRSSCEEETKVREGQRLNGQLKIVTVQCGKSGHLTKSFRVLFSVIQFIGGYS